MVLPSHQYQDVEHNSQEDVGPVPNVAVKRKMMRQTCMQDQATVHIFAKQTDAYISITVTESALYSPFVNEHLRVPVVPQSVLNMKM